MRSVHPGIDVQQRLLLWDASERKVWESFEAEEFWGHIGFCLDRQDRIEERDALFTSHEMTETMAQYYSLCFLERGDADRAEEIMSPYKDSEDDVTEARFTWIDDIRKGREDE